MKKVLLITTLISGLFIACADNSANETDNSTDATETNSVDSTGVMSTDSTKAMEEKRVKDSAETAHGHSH